MKAVLISIQPKWCEKIAARWKSLELRKSKPNIPVPFKCYIYQTRHRWAFKLLRSLKLYNLSDALRKGFGKVIGEFVCDHILGHCEMGNADIAEQQSCVRRDKVFEYSGGKEVYGWHISDLVIYKEPKPLGAFNYACDKDMEMDCTICAELGVLKCKPVTRPPQSWCYVQEV